MEVGARSLRGWDPVGNCRACHSARRAVPVSGHCQSLQRPRVEVSRRRDCRSQLRLHWCGCAPGRSVRFVRYRTSAYRERQQLKWFAYAATLAAAAVVATIVLRADLDPSADAQLIVIAYWLALGALPVAIGIAVLRHRLYDIDVLISR